MAAAACGEPGVTDEGEDTGAVQIAVSRGALSRYNVSAVGVTVSSPTRANTFQTSLYNNGTRWTGLIDYIPVGTDWQFAGSATDYYGTPIFSGSALPVTIEADRTAFVQLNLQQIEAAVPYANNAPQITALTASAIEVQPTDRVVFGAAAVDADGDYLTYQWTSPDGSFIRDASKLQTVWESPRRMGVYPVQLQVWDNRGLVAAATINVTVLSTIQEGSANIEVDVNGFPEVQQVSSTAARIDVGESTQLSVSAYDGDNDALIYAWTSSCEGTFDATTSTAPTFTLGAVPADGTCVFTVDVDDGRGGTNHGTVTLGAGPLPNVVVGPRDVTITAPGEAYGHNGTCSGWNACGNAQTCALWACQANGFAELVSYGSSNTADYYSPVHLLGSGPSSANVYWNWNGGYYCRLNAVTDIVCR